MEPKPYLPSNGTEGSCFEERFCDRCKREDVERDQFCQIHNDALFGLQPKEWIQDDQGPRCTAWKDQDEPDKTTTDIFKNMMDLPFKGER